MTLLEEQMNTLCDAVPFHFGWSFIDLTTGEHCNHNGDVVVPSASTRKVAILMTALRLAGQGHLNLSEKIQIPEQFHKNNSGVLRYLSPDLVLTVQDALTLMIIVSDNACTGTIVERIGLDTVNDFCQSVGMNHTLHRWGFPPYENHLVTMDNFLEVANLTTPNDVAHLLELIARAPDDATLARQLGVPQELCRLAVQILLEQQFSRKLPVFLPKEAKVAHKTGRNFRSENDVGIIYVKDKPRFVLAVYTDRLHEAPNAPDGTPPPAQAVQLIGHMCRACYDHVISVDTHQSVRINK